MSIKELVKVSRFYGENPDFLLAGGGNTSFKDKRYIYVKASGFKMASIGEDGFVKLDRNALNRIWEKRYPAFKNKYITFENNTEISAAVKDSASFEKVHSSYTPDHIVYAGPEMSFVEDLDGIGQDINQYKERNWCHPKVIAVKMTGVFALGDEENSSHVIMLFFLDALKIAVYAESFGGYKFMNKEQIDFIKNWEVEEFRLKVN
ncbi:MAG: hypothetical protein JW983_07695 [Elusimicrobia bacterium]|nr:hypothetical protein [Elusimicrobiota bacterium]